MYPLDLLQTKQLVESYTLEFSKWDKGVGNIKEVWSSETTIIIATTKTTIRGRFKSREALYFSLIPLLKESFALKKNS